MKKLFCYALFFGVVGPAIGMVIAAPVLMQSVLHEAEGSMRILFQLLIVCFLLGYICWGAAAVLTGVVASLLVDGPAKSFMVGAAGALFSYLTFLVLEMIIKNGFIFDNQHFTLIATFSGFIAGMSLNWFCEWWQARRKVAAMPQQINRAAL